MPIVRPWHTGVEQYWAAGRDVKPEVAPDCPRCGAPTVFSSGYERDVRIAFDQASSTPRRRRIWVPRVRCTACGSTPGLLPSFCLLRRLDAVGVIGAVVASVAAGTPLVAASDAQAIARSTARGWVRRLAQRASDVASSFASLAVSLGADAFDLASPPVRGALEAIGRAWEAARRRLAGHVVGLWQFVSVVSGGALLHTTRSPP